MLPPFDADDTAEAGGHQTEKQTSRPGGSELSHVARADMHSRAEARLILIGREVWARIRVTTQTLLS